MKAGRYGRMQLLQLGVPHFRDPSFRYGGPHMGCHLFGFIKLSSTLKLSRNVKVYSLECG